MGKTSTFMNRLGVEKDYTEEQIVTLVLEERNLVSDMAVLVCTCAERGWVNPAQYR